MKDIKKYLLSLLCISMGACSTDIVEEENIFADNEEITKVVAICPQLDSDYGDSRTAVTMGSYPNGKIVWADKDTIGIYPTSGDQLSFPIVEGVGTSECVFNGGGWALKADSSYTAYSPFNRAYYYKNKKKLPISMLGQKQWGNNNSAHLGKYDIQAAKGNKPTNGSLTFELKRKVTFVRLDLTAPKTAEWASITLESDASFTTEASMDLSPKTPTLTSTQTATSITLELQNVNTKDSLHIVAYMACLPVDLTGKTLTVKLTDSEGVAYTIDASIVNNRTNFEANGIRWITADFVEKTVTLTEAGTLSSLLTEDDANLTSLKIVGPIHGGDFYYLREKLKGTSYSEPAWNKLVTIDLSEASIVEDKYYETSNNEAPYQMFYSCFNLKNILLPKNLTSIGASAFYDCDGLTNIVVPDGVTSIGAYAFYDCDGITSFVIPKGVTSIEGSTFYECSQLTSIVIPEGVTSIDDYAFYQCRQLTNVVIPGGVTSIGQNAFTYCVGLTNVTIPEGVTSINAYAFRGCSGLTNVTISNSVTLINDYAFSECTRLTNIVIPNGVTSIGDGAFYGCSGLKEWHCYATTLPTIGTYTFSNIPNDAILHVPAGCIDAYKTSWGTYFTNILEMN